MKKLVAVSMLLLSFAMPVTAAERNPVERYIASNYGTAKAERFAPIINEKAKKYHLDPLLVARLIKLESDFNPKERSGKDAIGLMQVRQGHAKHGEDLYDPRTNIEFGCRILQEYTQQFDGDMHKGLSAYLHGPIYVASRGVNRTRYSRRLLGK